MSTSRPRPVLESVVKVLTVSDAPDYEQPWQTHGPASGTGSGAIVRTPSGLRVLTNAHVVQNQVFVEVRRYGSAHKFVAEVEGVGHECDLALLSVPDKSFFRGATPIQIAALPYLSDRVAVCGYPIGGDRLSVTEGIVSRIEVLSYAQSQRPLLGIQIDAAINAGNSGGPVFMGDRLVGVAFQALEEGQNIAYAIAPPVVKHFLRDLASGRRSGFPDLGVWWQRLENPAHRKALGLGPDDGGVLVRRVGYRGSAWGVLEPGDVILQIGPTKVEVDGTVPLREGELVDFSYLVSQELVGDPLSITVLRDKKRIDVRVTLTKPQHLVPEDRYDVRPTYFVYGGLLFVPLTRDYLKSWGQEWWKTAPHDLIALYESGIPTPDRVDIVLLQKVLADPSNQGYHEIENVVITEVNGQPISGIKDLVRAVDTAEGRFIRFVSNIRREIVLERAVAERRAKAILDRYGVPADRSRDLEVKRPRPRARRPR